MYENLDMHLIDVTTSYLYESPRRIKIFETYKLTSQELYSIKLQRSLYGLKQLERMWYNCLSGYYIVIYVDDLNIIETPKELSNVIKYVEEEFKMKDLRKINFLFANWGLTGGLCVHQPIWLITFKKNMWKKRKVRK